MMKKVQFNMIWRTDLKKIKNSNGVRKILCIISISFGLLAVAEVACFAETVTSIVDKANDLYKNRKYDESLKGYSEALSKLPNSKIINFNIGDVYYRKSDYQKADEAFSKVLVGKGEALEAKTIYNIGNCKYKEGKLKEKTDLSKAIDSYKEALGYYKKTIESDEKDKDAKFNYEFVEKKIKLLSEQKKTEQQNQNQQNKEQEEEKNKSSQQQQGGESKEGSQGKDKAQQGSKPQNGEKSKKNGSEGKEQDNKDQEKEKSEQLSDNSQNQKKAGTEQNESSREVSREMSEEEAKILLEGYKQKEGSKINDKVKVPVRYPEVLKDW